MSVTGRLSQWISTGFVPGSVGRWEWLVMRLGTVAIVLHILSEPHPFTLETEDAPVGIAKLIPLNFLCHPQAHAVVLAIAGLLSLCYIWGKGLRWSALGLFLVLTVVRTHFNSQGYTHHGTQLVALCLLAQCVTAFWYARRKTKPELSLASYLVYYTQGMIAISYVASALTKIINSKGLWLWRSKYICAELIKTHRLDYYKELKPELMGDPPFALWLLQHPLAGQVLFGAGFVLEVVALAALHSRKWALAIGLSIIAMHESISFIMRLHFTNHEWLALLYLVNPLFWLMYLSVKKDAESD
jgi:hypothetical protein